MTHNPRNADRPDGRSDADPTTDRSDPDAQGARPASTDVIERGPAVLDDDGGPTVTGDDETNGAIADTSRRTFLRVAAGAGALAAGFGSGLVGTAGAQVIPTPPLHVEGNLVLDPDGATVKIRGVNMADPKRINVTAPARGKTAEQVVDTLTNTDDDWYSRAIRIPVQPVDIGEHPPGEGPPPVAFSQSQLDTYLEEHLDPVVQRCLERGAYAIIDYHRHRDIQWTDTSLHDEVELFWETIAPRYADQPHVMYELYNEPQEPGMWGDPTQSSNWADTWRDWKSTAQPWVDLIRDNAPDNLILIGSPSWSQSPEGALVEPFDGENLAYTYHIYPGHNVSAESCQCWDDATTNGEGVANVYEEYPLFVTEFGWEANAGQYIGGTDTFGTAFLDWLEGSDGIHWTAWCGDPVWRPVMFEREFADTSFEDNIGNPYEESIPEECSSLPCDWSVLGGSGGMGDDIKQALVDFQDDNPPTVPYDQQAPSTPSNLTVEGTTEVTVDVSWDAASDTGDTDVAGMDHYNVYVDGTKHSEVPEGTTSTTVSDLEPDTSYDIGVSAVDRAQNESDTVTVSATTGVFEDSTAPSVPGNLAAPTKTHRTITVAWDASTDAGDAETAGMDHYNVYIDGSLDREVDAGTTQVQIGGLDSDTTYEFGVSAVDQAGNESSQATLSVATDLARADASDLLINDYDGDPAWPDSNELGNWTGSGGFQSIGVTDGVLEIDYDGSGWYGTQVAQDVSEYPTLRLNVSGENGGEESDVEVNFGGVTAMLPELTDDTIGTGETIVSIDLEAAGVDRSSPGQLTFRFYDSGDSSIGIEELWLDSGSTDDGNGGDTEAPTAPTNLTSPSQTDTSVEVEWDASSDAGGSGLDHYTVSVDGSQDQQVAAGTTSATISDLAAGTSYDVGVSAVDGAGNESTQAMLTVATTGGEDDTQAPTPPSNLTSPSQTDTSIDLDWDASTDAGTGLDHYNVYVDGSQDQQVAAGTTTATVSDLSAGTTYEIAVSAVDGAGNESPQATLSAATTGADDTEAPSTPENLTVTGATAPSIAVSWDAATDTGGSGLDHYNVSLDGSLDQQVEAGTTEATVVGLSADTTYEIGVSAVDAAGNESDTATVSETTPPGDPGPILLVNDYDGSPAWPGSNDLGNWNGAGSFENGGGTGEVVDGALELEYDDAGWFVEQIGQDVSDYGTLVFDIGGASGGEGEDFTVSIGGARGTLADLADGSIDTATSNVSIDLEAAGVDQSSPGELRLNFWEGASGSSTLTIEQIRFE